MELIPRPEHPNPQRMRENWRNLNGIWEFEMDPANSGFERGFVEKEHFSKEIFVPFCPESQLSGIGYTDFMEAVWYKKHIELSEEELRGAVLLHFGAVDYETAVFVNGREAGRHSGGYSSFFLDITPYAVTGNNVFTVQAVDRTRSHLQPTGKQSERFFSYGCSYTRTTGIWQTVWLEFVPKKRIISFRIVPDTDTCSVQLSVSTNAPGNLKAECFYKGSPMGEKNMFISGREACFEIALKEKHLWEVGCGRLYDVKLTLKRIRSIAILGCGIFVLTACAFCSTAVPYFSVWCWIRGSILTAFIRRRMRKHCKKILRFPNSWALMGHACMKKYLSLGFYITVIKPDIWYGGSIPTGAWTFPVRKHCIS